MWSTITRRRVKFRLMGLYNSSTNLSCHLLDVFFRCLEHQELAFAFCQWWTLRSASTLRALGFGLVTSPCHGHNRLFPFPCRKKRWDARLFVDSIKWLFIELSSLWVVLELLVERVIGSHVSVVLTKRFQEVFRWCPSTFWLWQFANPFVNADSTTFDVLDEARFSHAAWCATALHHESTISCSLIYFTTFHALCFLSLFYAIRLDSVRYIKRDNSFSFTQYDIVACALNNTNGLKLRLHNYIASSSWRTSTWMLHNLHTHTWPKGGVFGNWCPLATGHAFCFLTFFHPIRLHILVCTKVPHQEVFVFVLVVEACMQDIHYRSSSLSL